MNKKSTITNAHVRQKSANENPLETWLARITTWIAVSMGVAVLIIEFVKWWTK